MNLVDNYVLLIRVLNEDKQLLSWFLKLSNLPKHIRQAELNVMINKMTKAKEQEEMIKLMKGLRNEDVFRAVLSIVQHSD